MKFRDSRGCRSLLDYVQVSVLDCEDDGCPTISLRSSSSQSNFSESLVPELGIVGGGGMVSLIPPEVLSSPPTFRIMPSHREVLSVLEDLRRRGMCKFNVEDVQEHHDIMFPDGQSPESVGVRLRELAKHGFVGKEMCGKRVIYYAYTEVRI